MVLRREREGGQVPLGTPKRERVAKCPLVLPIVGTPKREREGGSKCPSVLRILCAFGDSRFWLLLAEAHTTLNAK